jgi:hypothetical protein
MATAEAQRSVEFKRTLTWRDGFILALVIPMSGFTLAGYEIGAIGAWGAQDRQRGPELWRVSQRLEFEPASTAAPAE